MRTDAEIQKKAFDSLVEQGVYNAESEHALPMQKFFLDVFSDALQLASASGSFSLSGGSLGILECGCGAGNWLALAAKNLNLNQSQSSVDSQFYGYDISPAMVETTRKRLTGVVEESHIREGDLLAAVSYSFPDEVSAFDLIFAYDVIQQLPRGMQEQAVRLALQHLKPGGVYVVYDHEAGTSYGRRMAAKKFITRYFGINLVPRYYCNARYPRLRAMRKKIESTGDFMCDWREDVDSPKCALIIHKRMGS